MLKFKSDTKYRIEILETIFDSKKSFETNIEWEDTYMVLSMYIAINYTYFDVEESEKYSPN